MENLVIKFAGDSGDGIQLIGTMFSNVVSKLGKQIFTFPSYPADMRAPKNSLQGVSSFQIKFGEDVNEPGDKCDILVCMNSSSYLANKNSVKDDGIVFIEQLSAPDVVIENKHLAIPFTAQCDVFSRPKSRNMFVLGFIGYYLDINKEHFEQEIKKKFEKNEELCNINTRILSKAYDLCENNQIQKHPIVFDSEHPNKGELMSGCSAACKGLIRAAKTLDKQLFLASYPITPATDILIELEKARKQGVVAVQAEDEIAAACMCIGAGFGGNIAVTSTSGPGLCLKSEAINLAVMAEIPMVIIDVQRGGPSTGLPTKTEQSDLNIALYGRSGDSPIHVIAANSPSDCFVKAYEAVKIAVEKKAPVILLMDAYIGNGLQMCDTTQELPNIYPSKEWTVPGDEQTKVLGGSEVDKKTLTITTDSENHELNTSLRWRKVMLSDTPKMIFEGVGNKVLVGWGSTKGKIKEIQKRLLEKGHDFEITHIDYLSPLPTNVEELTHYDRVFVIEQNYGQLSNLLWQNGIDTTTINDLSGNQLDVEKIVEKIEAYL
jgi:2-oxoglutarate ferredoxin oxidoreductase subunit alpha